MKKKLSFFIVGIGSIIVNNNPIFHKYSQEYMQKEKKCTETAHIFKNLPNKKSEGVYYLSNNKSYFSKTFNWFDPEQGSILVDDHWYKPVELFFVFEWEIGNSILQLLNKKIQVDLHETEFSKVIVKDIQASNNLTLTHLYNGFTLGRVSYPGYVNDLSSASNYADKHLFDLKGLKYQLDPYKSGQMDVRLSTGFVWYRSQKTGNYNLQFIVYFISQVNGTLSYFSPFSLWIILGTAFKFASTRW